MTKLPHVAAAIAFAFAGASFANDPGAPKGGSSASSQQPGLSAAAQCDTLVGDKKEQCLRQAQQNRGGASTATPGMGANPSSPRGTGATGTDAATGTVRP
jgi:hypothetical protein